MDIKMEHPFIISIYIFFFWPRIGKCVLLVIILANTIYKFLNRRNVTPSILNNENQPALFFCLLRLTFQAMCNIGCYKEGITHFHNALNLLKWPQPTNKFALVTRTWKAYLVQLLHLKMPGEFQENKRYVFFRFSLSLFTLLWIEKILVVVFFTDFYRYLRLPYLPS